MSTVPDILAAFVNDEEIKPEPKAVKRERKPPKLTYYELLKDPRWQRKRLEVMEAAEFKCEACRAEDKTLNVHHSYYEKDCQPWEYPTESLKCLCEKCHKYADEQRLELKRVIGLLTVFDQAIVLGFAKMLNLQMTSEPCELSNAFQVRGALHASIPMGTESRKTASAMFTRQQCTATSDAQFDVCMPLVIKDLATYCGIDMDASMRQPQSITEDCSA